MGKKVRGQGSVRMREDTGKYVIDYYDNLGKRHIETAGTNKREAVDKLTEKMNQIRTGTYRAWGRKDLQGVCGEVAGREGRYQGCN
jgi:hypothetical protein